MHQKFSIMMPIWIILVCFISITTTTHSAARADTAPSLTLISGKAVQGGMLVFQTAASNTVMLDGIELPVSPDGLFVLGFHRDDKDPQQLLAIDVSGKTAKLTLTPEVREWEVQRIDNLPTNMVTPPEEVITRIKKDIKNVKAARATISDFDDVLKNGFIWPVWGRISGIYGAQRILNGKPRQPHYGIDIAAPSGVAVQAAAAGQVTMAEDLYFTGGTVIIDHGYGLNSTYSHLKDMYVRPGDLVTSGGVIGSVGSAGRSTGPHLDWRINWRHKRLDPLLIAGPLRPALPASRPNY
ncbi:M23 family metallopeptidase [Alphaproteobacteria bacterium]|nr:M23 family metallopeptidase [Alphaproteobacteria bacterium]